jgi:hypothetical protein
MIREYAGILEEDEYSCLKCGNSYLIEAINEDFNSGDMVFVRYFLLDKEVSLGQAETALIMKTIGGNIDKLNFVLDAYSEYTIEDYDETLIIGGHDLFDELQGEEGEFLILVIERKEPA